MCFSRIGFNSRAGSGAPAFHPVWRSSLLSWTGKIPRALTPTNPSFAENSRHEITSHYLPVFVRLRSPHHRAGRATIRVHARPCADHGRRRAYARLELYPDENGTAHVTRVVPDPEGLSVQSQHFLRRREPDQGPPQPLEERRKSTDAYTAHARIEWTQVCPNTIVEDKMAGVPVRIVTPEGLPEANKDKVLLNLHGGGFNSDSGLVYRINSDRELHQDQGRRGALSPRAGESVSGGGRRLGGCVQGAAFEDLQAGPHCHLRDFGGSDPHRRGCLEASAA